jgi:integrase
MTTFDMAQTAELLETMRGTRLLIPVVLGVLCGLRRGEIAALRWRNVDLFAGKVAVVESAEQTATGVRYKPPKSGRGRASLLACPQAQKGMRVTVGDMEGLVLERLRAFFVSRTNIGGRPISPKKPPPSAFGRSTSSGP